MARQHPKRTKHTTPRQETSKQSQQTPTFLLELPLVVDEGQAKRLRAHLEAGRQ
ncbi:MAG TPA: transposase, partial [Ktedonobacteraceae bacterium]|nr:transposase [Ktedonobacteraceae bacterium]